MREARGGLRGHATARTRLRRCPRTAATPSEQTTRESAAHPPTCVPACLSSGRHHLAPVKCVPPRAPLSSVAAAGASPPTSVPSPALAVSSFISLRSGSQFLFFSFRWAPPISPVFPPAPLYR